jgi:RNA polymerase sigma-70 factor (ECF subfamily)
MDAERRSAIHAAMVRLADGDRAAFDVLLDELWPVILAFAERGVGKGPDAEDIAQETFFKLCSRISDFDRARDGLSWAFGIAGYEILTQRKRRRRRREVSAEAVLEHAPDASASQEDSLLEREQRTALEQTLQTLDEEDRIALGLVPALPAPHLPSPQVASATLRKRKQRALDRLRGLWRSIHGEP